ncbi:hypothetical protein [Abyssalbus ytuae]|uniref:Uncharacterized protein n=1 Tax=Abyssalbus ytuae TaxID=2926907 RepID=A0A9E6ZMG9_9FLAO|nr:hypothetical protein [Abyssalbus ytuae]UOB18554.1 hypothetical protein MQE35_04515 [Abyssalbus ytuae]
MIVISKRIFPERFEGLTLWPVIILKYDNLRNDEVLINHERIHLKQQLELFILPFYIIYFIEWVIGIFKYKDAHLAYRNISFEREAYKNEENLKYLKTRPLFSSFKYFLA